MKPLLAVATALLFILGCTTSTPFTPPGHWSKENAGPFEFYLPPDVKEVPVQGIDSFVGSYKGDSISVGFDYGIYSDPLKYRNKRNLSSHKEIIDGKKAKIVSFYNPNSGHPFDNAIGVHFHDLNGHDTHLTVFCTCKSVSDYKTAESIFRTIKFKTGP